MRNHYHPNLLLCQPIQLTHERVKKLLSGLRRLYRNSDATVALDIESGSLV